MKAFLAFPAPILPSHFTTATSQDGAKVTKLVQSASNAGDTTIKAYGALDAVANPTLVFTKPPDEWPGNLLIDANYKYSNDGGTTWKGRYNGEFTDGDVDTPVDGSYATAFSSGPGYAWDSVTNPVYADTNGDGIPDVVFVAAGDSTNKVGILMKTTDLGKPASEQAWTGVTLFAAGRNLVRVGSLVIRNNLIFVTTFMDDATNHYIELWRTADFGLTWADTRIHKESGTILPQDTIPRACLCKSGSIAIVYPYHDGSVYTISMRTTWNGVDLSARKVIDDSTNCQYPTVVAHYNGETFVIYKNTDGNVCKAKYTTSWVPDQGTWSAAAWTMTTFDSSANIIQHNAMMGPDGTIYIFAVNNSGDDKVIYTKLKGGTGTFPAPTDVLTVTGKNFSMPGCGMVGGALWLMASNLTDNTATIQQTRYFVDLEEDAEGEATNPSWTGDEMNHFWTNYDYSMHYVGDGLWLKFNGTYAAKGDAWAGDVVYVYGGHRMVMYRPKFPARSMADSVEWTADFDLSAYVPLPFDSVFVMTNASAVLLKGDDAEDWATPEWSAALSTTREVIASNYWTKSGYAATRIDGGTFVPHFYKGKYVQFGIGRSILIVDNNATTLFCATSLATESGSMKILTGRGWLRTTMTAKKYLRVTIAPEMTASGKYEISCLIFGQWSALTAAQRVSTWEVQAPAEDYETPGGSLIRYPLTSQSRTAGRLSILAPTINQYRELSTQFAALEGKPIAYVRDEDDPSWWELMMPQARIAWNPKKTDIDLVEVI